MPIISQIICDGCRAVKKETNHWYTLVINQDHEACVRPMAKSPVDLFKPDAAVQYLCGRRCVIEALDHWMDRFTAPPLQPFHGNSKSPLSRPPDAVAAKGPSNK
jgi:hypothetical protein